MTPENDRQLIIDEWLAKAEADLATARREFAFSGKRNFDAIGFHAQQAAEKLMKAVLISRDAPAPKIHDLESLDQLLRLVGVDRRIDATDLGDLTSAAVHARYPGNDITAANAEKLLATSESVWAWLRPLV